MSESEEKHDNFSSKDDAAVSHSSRSSRSSSDSLAGDDSPSTASPSQQSQKKSTLDGPCYFKFQVQNVVAGSIIGKSGTVIGQIERDTACTIKLSPGNFAFQSYTNRIVVISGEFDAIIKAIKIIVAKIAECELAKKSAPDDASDSYDGDRTITINTIVSRSALSLLNSHPTDSIASIESRCNVAIALPVKDEVFSEHVISVSGLHSNVEEALLIIADVIQKDPNLKSIVTSFNSPSYRSMRLYCNPNHIMGQRPPSTYSQYSSAPLYGVGSPAMPYPPDVSPMYPHTMDYARNPEIFSRKCEITMRIPDENVGLLIGRRGECLMEITRHSGAKVQISSKGDLISGSEDRKCIITGGVGNVHHAHMLLLNKLESLRNLRCVSDHSNNYNPPGSNGLLVGGMGMRVTAPPFSYNAPFNGGY